MLPDSMIAAVLHGPGDLRIEDRPLPQPNDDDVTIRVRFCGICGTDLHYWDGWQFDAWLPSHAEPWVPGHEFTGSVVAVGDAVSDLTPGRQVVVDPWTPCGACPACARGLANFCQDRGARTSSGAWAEYVVVDHHNVTPLPEHLDPKLATLTEPLACVLRGFDRITPRAGDHVLITGAGPIGLLALRVAKHMGAAHVIASEPQAARREVLARLGADTILDPTADDVPDAVRDLTRGFGADLSIETSGANSGFQTCLEGVRDSGTVLVLSVGNPAATFELRLFDFFAHELRIVGSNTRLNTFGRALDLLPSLGLEPIITHQLPLGEAERAVRIAKSGRGAKVVLDCRA